MTSIERDLFVYGTLRRGCENELAKLLQRSADWIGHARARGRLYLINDYPGFVPSETEGDWVYGDVFHLHAPELIYPELDQYEGCSTDCAQPHEYRRSLSRIELDSGTWMEASIYFYVWDVTGKWRIMSGDFLAEQAGRV